MSGVRAGAKVKIQYTLTVEGAVVDSSQGREPLEYEHGSGMLVPGVEAALEGKEAGAKLKATVAPKDGYGEADPELMLTAPKEAFAQMGDLKVGSVVRASGPDGEFRAVVKEIADTVVTLDLNHPLAGKTLEFDLEVVSVEPPKSKIILP